MGERHPALLPLQWVESPYPGFYGDRPDYAAHTPFGSFYVRYEEYRGWVWGYCFDEYHDEDNFGCDGPEVGKALAEDHWQERMAPMLAPPALSDEKEG